MVMVGLARLLRTGCETSSALSVIKILHTFVLRLASLVCNYAPILFHKRDPTPAIELHVCAHAVATPYWQKG